MAAVISIVGVILLLALLYLLLIKPGRGSVPAAARCDFTHRGLHDDKIPENSLAAYRAAIDAGYGIELDLQLSSDGEVFVFHDYSLERMTGDKHKLSELTAEELRELRLAGTDEHIPRLREVLELVNGRVPLLVELKGESTDTALCPKANELLAKYKGSYVVESFNPMLLNWYKRYRPEVVRGQLYTDVCKAKRLSVLNLGLTLMLTNILSRPQFIAFDKETMNNLPVKLTTRLFRAERYVWTIRSEEEYAAADGYKIFEGFVPKNHH